MKPKSLTIDEYISGFPEKTQKALKQVRATIKKVTPGAEETISYAMPTFKTNGNYLIYFAGYKNHVGLYALPKAHATFKKELAGYKTGRGSVQFPLDKPMPLKLITKMVKFRLKENMEREKAKKKK